MSSGVSEDQSAYGGTIPTASLRAFLFSSNGRIARGRFWLGAVAIVLYAAVAAALLWALWLAFPGSQDEDGGFKVDGLQALPYLVVVFGFLVLSVWSGICLGIKRYHDRGKSGLWILVQFIPCIGSIWYFIEAGCCRGTVGTNSYGPDPLGRAH